MMKGIDMAGYVDRDSTLVTLRSEDHGDATVRVRTHTVDNTAVVDLFEYEPEAVKRHSAVHGDLNVLTETQLETKAILDAWRVIMQAAADKAEEILSAFRKEQSEFASGLADGLDV
jgi:hypothetical protein